MTAGKDAARNRETIMSFMQPTRDELAVHEAAHAYAFASLIRFEEPVELGLGTDSEGRAIGWCRRANLILAGTRRDTVAPEIRSHLEWQSNADILIAMAGPVAEFRYRHRSRSAGLRSTLALIPAVLSPIRDNIDGDFSRVRMVVEALEPENEHDFVAALVRAADAIVSSDWRQIGLLAHRLAQTGTLGEDEIVEWFARHPATPQDVPRAAPTAGS